MFFILFIISYSTNSTETNQNQGSTNFTGKGVIENLKITLDTHKQNLASKNIQPLSNSVSQLNGIYGPAIISMSMKPEEEIELSTDNHPVFNGYVRAFKEHRPITISPDILWLLIVQGFSYHIARNREELRSMFVNFSSTKELIVNLSAPSIESITSEQWMEVFPEFVDQIKSYTGESIIDTLTPNFSTTTAISRAAGQISIMSAMKYYFEYRAVLCVCGFPYIYVEGTLDDWIKIDQKIENLRSFKLDDWIDNLRPIIKKIIDSKNGEIDLEFWNSMIHIKDDNGAYDPSCFDGWFSKFFPYDIHGRGLNGRITSVTILPSEILTVPFVLEVTDDLNKKGIEEKCDFLAGFVGVTQDNETFSIKPKIGWIIRHNVQYQKNHKSSEESRKEYKNDMEKFKENMEKFKEKMDKFKEEMDRYKENMDRHNENMRENL